jgi:hypothetical protein
LRDLSSFAARCNPGDTELENSTKTKEKGNRCEKNKHTNNAADQKDDLFFARGPVFGGLRLPLKAPPVDFLQDPQSILRFFLLLPAQIGHTGFPFFDPFRIGMLEILECMVQRPEIPSAVDAMIRPSPIHTAADCAYCRYRCAALGAIFCLLRVQNVALRAKAARTGVDIPTIGADGAAIGFDLQRGSAMSACDRAYRLHVDLPQIRSQVPVYRLYFLQAVYSS